MLFAALAPSASHAMSAASGDVWTEICSVAGIKLVKLVKPVDADAGSDATQIAHCAFCATHPTQAALLPGNAWCIPLVLGRDAYPALSVHSPRPLDPWTRAQSRAPPVTL